MRTLLTIAALFVPTLALADPGANDVAATAVPDDDGEPRNGRMLYNLQVNSKFGLVLQVSVHDYRRNIRVENLVVPFTLMSDPTVPRLRAFAEWYSDPDNALKLPAE